MLFDDLEMQCGTEENCVSIFQVCDLQVELELAKTDKAFKLEVVWSNVDLSTEVLKTYQ